MLLAFLTSNASRLLADVESSAPTIRRAKSAFEVRILSIVDSKLQGRPYKRAVGFVFLLSALSQVGACHHVERPAARASGEIGTSAEVAATIPLSASAGVGGSKVRTDVASKDIVLAEYVPVRRYGDVFTTDGVNRKVFVEYGWDYKRGIVIETIYDATGKLQSRTDKPGYTLNFTDRELELAIALARENPTLRDRLSAGDLNFYAGFAYRESTDVGCAEGSRCVHVIVSAGDGQRHVAHAIVDLMTRRVVHASLDPNRKPDPADK